MVARRPREREAVATHRFDRRARSEERGVEARLGADRVGIEPTACVPHALDERRRMASQHVVLARRLAADEREALVQRDDACLRLGMCPGRVQRCKA